ncbi:hypothetical protein M0811_12522 [Anaeramoeba ignava]|uniref:PSI domain-containing protein n=1 Tax=Anaeramoeba ignava TaxID=1746090 RepID=A0A9Q0R6E0_ANAIG|nr:hypothetical protein M0811_12522 [Anaeramoeba ignava]
MYGFFYFLVIIGYVLSSTCTSKTSCTSCLDDYSCDWCKDNEQCYDSIFDNDNCNNWEYFKSDCPGYLAKILGAIFGAIAGVIILSICCVCLARRAQKKRLAAYNSSANSISIKPVTITTTIQQPIYEPSYQPNYQPNYQPSYQPNYQEPTYQPAFQPNYQQPNYEPSYQPAFQPNYQGPDNNYQGPVGMNFPDFSTYNPQQNPTQNN